MNGASHVSQAYASSILAVSALGLTPVIMDVPVVTPVAILAVTAGAYMPDIDIKSSALGKSFRKVSNICGIISVVSFTLTLLLAWMTYKQHGALILTRGYQKLTMLLTIIFGIVFVVNRLIKHRGITHDVYIPGLMIGLFWYISQNMTMDILVISLCSILIGFWFGYMCHLFAGDFWTSRGLVVLAPLNVKIGVPLVSTGTSSETMFVTLYNFACIALAIFLQRDNLINIYYAIQRFIQ